MNFEERVASMLADMMRNPQFATVAGLNNALRLLAKWRSKLIDNTVVARHGTVIQNGPFKGMTFVAETSEANVSPRILGSYEGELHPIVNTICDSGIECLIDIGCADGYYAVGLARKMSNLYVFAFDINPAAQQKCAELASVNGVQDRVAIAGEFRGEDFATYVDRRALVFLDAEGAEDDLLRPDLYPALSRLSILVECHDVFRPGLSERIQERFASSHAIQRIEPSLHCPELPDWFSKTSHLDQLLAAWEWRMGPTPWLYMVPKAT